MPLPLCVRTELGDRQSRESMEADGWRMIGVLETWSGNVEGKLRGARADQPARERIIADVPVYGFSGRLFRDPEIDGRDAIEATRSMIRSHPGPMFYTLESGFGLFTRNGELLTINLIGCLDRGKGTAQDIVRTAVYETEATALRAGSYSDNVAAGALYQSLGLRLFCREFVWHK